MGREQKLPESQIYNVTEAFARRALPPGVENIEALLHAGDMETVFDYLPAAARVVVDDPGGRPGARALVHRRGVHGPRAGGGAGPAGLRPARAVLDRRERLAARAPTPAGVARPDRRDRRDRRRGGRRRARRRPPRAAPRDRGAARQRPRARAAGGAARRLDRRPAARAAHLADARVGRAAGRHPARLRPRAARRPRHARDGLARLAGAGRDRRRGLAARRRLRAARRPARRRRRAEHLRRAGAAPRRAGHPPVERGGAARADPGGRLPGPRRARHRALRRADPHLGGGRRAGVPAAPLREGRQAVRARVAARPGAALQLRRRHRARARPPGRADLDQDQGARAQAPCARWPTSCSR